MAVQMDEDRLQDQIDSLLFRVGGLLGALTAPNARTPDARENVVALIGEIRSVVRQMPIRAGDDGGLDVSQCPAWAKAKIQGIAALLVRGILGVPERAGGDARVRSL